MSQDNPVTGVMQSSALSAFWTERAMSLAGIRLLRMRFIEQNFGRLEKCGCQKQTRFPKPQEESRLYCALLAEESAGRVRESTQCSLYDKGWLVWQPDIGGYLWAEIIEIDRISSIISANQNVKSLDEWEQLGRGEVNFRVCPLENFLAESFSRRLRISVVRDLLQRNPKFSHVNFVIGENLNHSALETLAMDFSLVGLNIEKLRDRFLPCWQSGDMAIQRFTTYTITRKDTGSASTGTPQG